ncbi:hypothetical protein DdX_18001 [Ditylenchus destructor]|uniref:Uncharacterized protein n=1 Tax=Ditylenchus destructor TaxID=166010 RepID=A0AAD4MMD9_9BILA|nr:hypothetical protein DdX_18001 [Ditylenchus destructor]
MNRFLSMSQGDWYRSQFRQVSRSGDMASGNPVNPGFTLSNNPSLTADGGARSAADAHSARTVKVNFTSDCGFAAITCIIYASGRKTPNLGLSEPILPSQPRCQSS